MHMGLGSWEESRAAPFAAQCRSSATGFVLYVDFLLLLEPSTELTPPNQKAAPDEIQGNDEGA